MRVSNTGIAEIDDMLLKLWSEHHVSPRYIVMSKATLEHCKALLASLPQSNMLINVAVRRDKHEIYHNKYASAFGPAGNAEIRVVVSDVPDGEILYVTAVSEGV